MSARAFFGVGAGALLAVLGCAPSSTNDGSLTICRNLPVIEAGSSCSVSHAYLSCTFAGDGGAQLSETCLSDNVNTCPDFTGATYESCTDQCAPGDYAAACGGPPGADASAPSSAPPSPQCQSKYALPNGAVIYCCPCGS